MTNGQKMRKLFEEKKLVVAPGCHDALTAKIISYLGFSTLYNMRNDDFILPVYHNGQDDINK